jgi:hypothetical protein
MNHWFSHARNYGLAAVVLLAIGSVVGHLLPLP